MTASATEETTSPAENADTDLRVINPVEQTVTVAGISCRVRRIRMRELLLAARVLTSGVGPNLQTIDWDDDNVDQYVLGLLLMAIPEAYQEVLDLLRALVEPAEGLTDAQRNAFQQEMRNPDTGLGMDVIGIMLAQERETWPVLMGKARQVVGMVSALYRTGKKDS